VLFVCALTFLPDGSAGSFVCVQLLSVWLRLLLRPPAAAWGSGQVRTNPIWSDVSLSALQQIRHHKRNVRAVRRSWPPRLRRNTNRPRKIQNAAKGLDCDLHDGWL